MLIKRLKMSNSIKSVKINQILDHFGPFSINFELFSILNGSVESGVNLIYFVATIILDSKNSDQKFD